MAAVSTHDDLTVVIVGWPYAEFETNKKDIEGNYLQTVALAEEFSERLRGARRETPFAGAAMPNFFRKPYGPGWALVGDAGYIKDPVTGQGISDAFRDAELCANALDEAFTGKRSFDAAMAAYQQTRDEQVLSMYEFTCQLATLQPPPPELQQLLGAMQGNQKAMDGFAQMNAGTVSPATFFAPENVNAIMSAGKTYNPSYASSASSSAILL
jgi:2-polyprenyl-6-methoxyphenol hydroxylase-like FAD-dependent oxidoreductase